MTSDSRAASERDPIQRLCHAIRTPLGAANNAVLLLQGDRALTDEQRWSVDLIERQIVAIAALLDQQSAAIMSTSTIHGKPDEQP